MSNSLQAFVHTLRFEAQDTISVELRPVDGGEFPAFTAGSHIDLHLPNGLVRSYSLSNDSSERHRYVVGVLRDRASRGGSRCVHESLRVGMPITISEPRNHFALVNSPRYQFVAGGIGITPMLPMIEAAEATGADWQLIYGGSSRSSMSYVDALERFGDRVTYRDIRTEVGLVNKDNSLQVDIPRLEHELTDFMAGWDTAVTAEVAILRDLPVACVISDISVIGIQVGERLGVRNIGIANFTWCEQYEYLGLSDTIIDRFREVYAKLDLLIEYDLMLPAPKRFEKTPNSAYLAGRTRTIMARMASAELP